MIRTRRQRPARRRRRDARLETLEERFVLSTDTLAPYLSVIATNPADGSRLTAGPSTVTFTFDRPIFDGTQGFTDFQIDAVTSDNQLVPLIDPNVGVEEDLDPTGTQLTVVLDSPLPAGNYELFLSALNMLSGADGSVTNTPTDQYLASFTVLLPGTTMADAVDLGRATSNQITDTSSLDFSTNPTAVQLYKFTLTPDHFWRVGAEVSSARQGSPLRPALTLFNDLGQPIKYGSIGRANDAIDPYFFDGLPAGTYYLGVSDSNNVPGLSGGYNIVTGDPGTQSNTDPGGAYTLALAADPADVPSALIGFRVDHADPSAPTATGFELQFSSPLNAYGGTGSIDAALTNGIDLVDQSGKLWQVAATGYTDYEGKVSYIFVNPLPVGHYTVELAATGGLTDLAGKAPTAPGMPRGVLGQFDITPTDRTQPSLDLGPLFPGSLLNGVSQHTTIAPGQTVTFRYTGLYSDFIWRDIVDTGGPVNVRVNANGTSLIPFTAFGNDSALTRLVAGQNSIEVTNPSRTPTDVTIRFWIPGYAHDALLQTGVGQGPAMSLRLVSPVNSLAAFPSDPGPSQTPTPGPAETAPSAFIPPSGATSIGGTIAVSPNPSSGLPGATGAANPTTSTTAQAGVFLTFGGVPVGQQGLMGSGGGGSLGEADAIQAGAATSSGAISGVAYSPTDRISAAPRETGLPTRPPRRNTTAPPDGGLVFSGDAEIEHDVPTFAVPSLLEQVNRMIASLPSLFPGGEDATVQEQEQLAGEPSSPTPRGVVAPAVVEEAGFNHPIGVGLLAILLIQSRYRLNRWLGRGKTNQQSLTQSFRAYLSRGKTA
jgi:methionine-rich copper-binding protein CopC